MHSEIRSRFLALLALAVLGVGTVVAGSALGVGAAVTDAGSDVEFTASGSAITLSDGDVEVTLVDDMTTVESIELTEDDGRFEIETRTDDPLTADERQRAVEIATDNETVRDQLDGMDSYEFDVSAVEESSAEATVDVQFESVSGDFDGPTGTGAEADGDRDGADDRDETDDESDDAMTVDVTIADQREDAGEAGVTIDRDPAYVEDAATVRVSPADEDRATLAVTVDVADESVTSITDVNRSASGGTDAGNSVVLDDG